MREAVAGTLLLALGLTACIGCDEGPPPEPLANVGERSRPELTASPPPAEPRPQRVLPSEVAEPPAPKEPAAAAPPAPEPSPAASPEEQLRERVGSLLQRTTEQCFATVRLQPTTRRLEVAATVGLSATGLVTRASVEAPDPALARCVQARLERERIAGPVPNAPRTVRARRAFAVRPAVDDGKQPVATPADTR